MERLLRATTLLDNFSQKQTHSVQKRLCYIGRQIDGFIENTSSKNGYIIQVLLRLPIILAMHVWLLLGPATENRAFDLPLLCIRLSGAFGILCSWMFGTETLLLLYVSIFGELSIGYVEEALFWTFQNNADNVCYMTNVIAWGDDDDFWWMPVITMFLIETAYFWFFTRIRFNLLGASLLTFIPFLSVLILPAFGIFQNVTSTAAFCVNKIRLIIVMIEMSEDFEFMDKVFDLQKLNVEIVRYKGLNRIEKAKSLRRIKHLEQRVNVNLGLQQILNNFTSKFIQHMSLSFGICYFSAALILELLVFRTSVSHALDFYFVIQFFIAWSTSPAIVMVLASFFGLIGSLLNGLGVWLTTWDIDFADAVNSSNGMVSQLFFLQLLIESGIPSNYINIDIESLIVVVLLDIYGSLTIAFLQTTSKILEISNRGSTLPVWFYFRVLIVIIAFVIAPVSVSIIVASILMIHGCYSSLQGVQA
ncbi:uncharacterized protein LOC123544924 [Mercenaria mercenaria]|uniref:uncharacterized protein LOC123544924 n=1 Tax=Mercenaria mercenaria TaxID=6596 RepID=UPI00234F7428|nr:uncharacterized protein LOC123544924 [Mercenaria mercenaria]